LGQLKQDLSKNRVAWVETDREGKICEIGTAFHELCGYTEEEVVGRKPKDFLHGPETESGQVEMLSSYLWNRLPISTCLTNYRKNGEPYEVHLSIFPIAPSHDEDKADKGFFAVEFDITDQYAPTIDSRQMLF
jgi:PAS domain S-box-containing protein